MPSSQKWAALWFDLCLWRFCGTPPPPLHWEGPRDENRSVQSRILHIFFTEVRFSLCHSFGLSQTGTGYFPLFTHLKSFGLQRYKWQLYAYSNSVCILRYQKMPQWVNMSHGIPCGALSTASVHRPTIDELYEWGDKQPLYMAKPPKFQWAGLGGVSAGGLQNHLLVTPQKVLLFLLQFFWPYSRQTKFLPLCEGTALSGSPETPGSL